MVVSARSMAVQKISVEASLTWSAVTVMDCHNCRIVSICRAFSVEPFFFRLAATLPEVFPVLVNVNSLESDHAFGSLDTPSHPGQFHPVVDEIAATPILRCLDGSVLVAVVVSFHVFVNRH